MERNKTMDLYLTLNKKGLEETKDKASKDSIETHGVEEGEDDLLFANCRWEVDELYFNEDTNDLEINGEVFYDGKKIGYLNPKIDLGIETVIELIEYYRKKVGKLKTVLEATKD